MPNSNNLLFIANNHVFLKNLDDSTEIELHLPVFHDHWWLTQTQLLFLSEDNVYVYDMNKDDYQKISDQIIEIAPWGNDALDLSPNLVSLAFIDNNENIGVLRICNPYR